MSCNHFRIWSINTVWSQKIQFHYIVSFHWWACLGLNHFVYIFHMIRFVFLEDLLGLLEAEPPPLSDGLLPLLLGVETLHIQDKHPRPVALLCVLKFSQVATKFTWKIGKMLTQILNWSFKLWDTTTQRCFHS